MKKYNAIIFDLGGVILNLNYLLTINEFKRLGIENSNVFYSKSQQSNIFNQLEIGAISSKVFINNIKKNIPKSTEQELIYAWNLMLLDLPKVRLDYIKALKKKYKIFLLSNTNAIHINAIKNKLGAQEWMNFHNLFDKVYFSHIIGIRKPDQEAFKIILKENRLNPKEVLFIDDSLQHIKAAKKLGLNYYHLKFGDELTSIIPDIAL
jgi:putative hydrolase of the HAD superfamily